MNPADAKAALDAAEAKIAAAEAERREAEGALIAALASRGWRQLPFDWWEHPARGGRSYSTAEALEVEREAQAA